MRSGGEIEIEPALARDRGNIRVCQCLPLSTPTYLCKSFNLAPLSQRAAGGFPGPRDRISKPIRIHCLRREEYELPCSVSISLSLLLCLRSGGE